MSQNDNFLTDWFEEAGRQLEVSPSDRAWAKLEAKLDGKAKVEQSEVRRRTLYRSISIAAAVVALLAMLLAISIFKEISNNPSLVTKPTAPTEPQAPIAMNQTTEQQPFEQNEHEIALPKRVASPTKPVVTAPPHSSPVLPPEKSVVAPTPYTSVVPSVSSGNSNSDDMALVKDSEMNLSEEATEAEIAPPTPATAQNEEAQKPKPASRLSKSKIADSEKQSEVSNHYPNKKEKALSGNVPDYLTTRPLVDFEWLLGSWSEVLMTGISYEVWQKVSDAEFIGRGFLVQKSDTTFREEIRLKTTNNKVFLYLPVVPKQPATVFELKKTKGKEAIFEQIGVSNKPIKVTLTRKNDQTFTITMENLSDSNKTVLQPRNRVYKSRTERKLTKEF